MCWCAKTPPIYNSPLRSFTHHPHTTQTQVKSWSPSGELLSASGHHHTAVQCLALVPLQQQQQQQVPGGAAAGTGPGSSRRTSMADRRLSTANGGGMRGLSATPTAVPTSNGSNNEDGGSSSSSSRPAGVACKVWVGAADGSLSVCVDAAGSGLLDPAGWRVLRVDGLTGGLVLVVLVAQHAVGQRHVWLSCELALPAQRPTSCVLLE